MAQPTEQQQQHDEGNIGLNTASSEATCCPLCLEELDETDRHFFPCPCDYQVCLFCLDSLRNCVENKCPACRKVYEEKNFRYTEIKNLPETKRSQTKKGTGTGKTSQNHSLKSNEVLPKETNNYRNIRVVQRNLVYVLGLPQSIAKAEELKKLEYFGRYGEITNIVVAKHDHSTPPSYTAYVAYSKELYAADAIRDVDGATFERKLLKASFGTTKYCAFFLRGSKCMKPDCLYLHQFGSEEDSFTREQMSALRNRSSSLRGPPNENEAACETPMSLYRFQLQQRSRAKSRIFGHSVENAVLEDFRRFKSQNADLIKKHVPKKTTKTQSSSIIQTSSVEQTKASSARLTAKKNHSTKDEPKVLSKSDLNACKSVNNSLQLGQTKYRDKRQNESNQQQQQQQEESAQENSMFDRSPGHKQIEKISSEETRVASQNSFVPEHTLIEQSIKTETTNAMTADDIKQTEARKDTGDAPEASRNSVKTQEPPPPRTLKQLRTTCSSLIEILSDPPVVHNTEKHSSALNTHAFVNAHPPPQSDTTTHKESSLDTISSFQQSHPENLIAWPPPPYENYNFLDSCEPPRKPLLNYYEEPGSQTSFAQNQRSQYSEYNVRDRVPTDLYPYKTQNVSYALSNSGFPDSAPSYPTKLDENSVSSTCPPLPDNKAVTRFSHDVDPGLSMNQEKPSMYFQNYSPPDVIDSSAALGRKDLQHILSPTDSSSVIESGAETVPGRDKSSFASASQRRLTQTPALPFDYSEILEILDRQAQILENKLQRQLDEKIKQYHMAGDSATAEKIHKRRESIIMPILRYSLSESSKGLINQVVHDMRTATSQQKQQEIITISNGGRFLNNSVVAGSSEQAIQQTTIPPEFIKSHQTSNGSLQSVQQYTYSLKHQSPPYTQSSMFSFTDAYQNHQADDPSPPFFTADNSIADDRLQLLKSVLPNACINVTPFSQSCNNQKDLLHVNCKK